MSPCSTFCTEMWAAYRWITYSDLCWWVGVFFFVSGFGGERERMLWFLKRLYGFLAPNCRWWAAITPIRTRVWENEGWFAWVQLLGLREEGQLWFQGTIPVDAVHGKRSCRETHCPETHCPETHRPETHHPKIHRPRTHHPQTRHPKTHHPSTTEPEEISGG